ncbi:TetR/AcrR family transcriptional regulator [Legionella spiritensis]|uniref:TetR family transcriptional regulator n=1 Tax=Legionella spiritensis TaxID=452 RepID=A0A0W0Z563_LEGSP|nr:TetR/AcrR family transcriptional regulator [Legionella spiritensis]KTD64261.1 TetR family transcriptional regulator [Legionella spiritensis]SNV47065.1 TetR family transcriptional regulator [Legionella spiritensis]
MAIMKITIMQEKILATAENLIQKMGYNAFSYKDISQVVGIKTSSIHYYYPAKEDLAVAVIDWQLYQLSLFLNDLKYNSSLSLQQKLLSLVDKVMSLTLHDEMKMCLGGMLASDVMSLPEKVKVKVRSFFNILEKWIKEAISEGISDKDLFDITQLEGLPRDLLVQLEGGLLMSRLYEDISYVETVKHFIKRTF